MQAGDESQTSVPPHLDPDQFDVSKTDSVCAPTILHLTGHKERLGKMLAAMDRDGIRLGDYLSSGAAAYVAGVASEKGIIPSGVVRMENPKWNPIQEGNPVSLLSAYSKEYPLDIPDGQTAMSVKVVPYAPDLEVTPTEEDAARTMRVMKRLKIEQNDSARHCSVATDAELALPQTETLLDYFRDYKPDQFVFLRDPNHPDKLLSYPPSTDSDFAGKPIAFLRDLNATGMKTPDGTRQLARICKEFSMSDVAAPVECVEACKQQYDLTRKLAHDLREAGIEPNVSIPDAASPPVIAINSASPVQCVGEERVVE